MVTLILWLLSVKEKMEIKPYLIPFEEDWMKIYSFLNKRLQSFSRQNVLEFGRESK